MKSFTVCCVFLSTIFYSTKNIVNANNEFDHIKPSSDSYKLFFSETFDAADPFESGKWIKSSDDKYLDQPILIKPSSTAPTGFETDNGLFLAQEMKHYGFSSTFPSVLNNKDKDLVIQYEVKFEEGLSCGGAYVKLPRSTTDLDLSLMNSETPYAVMFGPDRCGGHNKVHFIIQHYNPVTGEWSEKHLKDAPAMISEKDETHLYTLVIRHDNSFEILIDKESVTKGNLLTHMQPEINPPKEINDPNDVKPIDWVDDAEIDDPNAKKPDDWDEDAPRYLSIYLSIYLSYFLSNFI
jgi:calnexin